MRIQYRDAEASAYRAGACNIGPEEVARRRSGALMALAVAVVLAAVLLVVDAPSVLRLAVFPPLAGSLIAFEQVRRRFCVAFGLAGIRNLGPLGSAVRVGDAADRLADRRAALILTAYASAIAFAVTLLFVALPV